MESSLKLISIPKDPVNSRKAVKDILDAVQMSCVKPDEASSTIVKHADAIRFVIDIVFLLWLRLLCAKLVCVCFTFYLYCDLIECCFFWRDLFLGIDLLHFHM